MDCVPLAPVEASAEASPPAPEAAEPEALPSAPALRTVIVAEPSSMLLRLREARPRPCPPCAAPDLACCALAPGGADPGIWAASAATAPIGTRHCRRARRILATGAALTGSLRRPTCRRARVYDCSATDGPTGSCCAFCSAELAAGCCSIASPEALRIPPASGLECIASFASFLAATSVSMHVAIAKSRFAANLGRGRIDLPRDTSRNAVMAALANSDGCECTD